MKTLLQKIQARYPLLTAELDGAVWSFRDTLPGGTTPLVMLPGAAGTGDVFYRVLDALGTRRRIITVNYPAVAETEALSAGLRQLLNHLGIPRMDVFGSSLGGFLAQLFAVENAGRVRRCMLGNTFFDASWLREQVSPADLALMPADEHIAKGIRAWEVAHERTEGETDLKRTMLALLGPHQTAEMGKAALLAVLRSRRVPKVPLSAGTVALLDAEDDPVVDRDTRTQLRERYAASRQYRLASGGHYPVLLNRVEFLKAIEAFFPYEP